MQTIYWLLKTLFKVSFKDSLICRFVSICKHQLLSLATIVHVLQHNHTWIKQLFWKQLVNLRAFLHLVTDKKKHKIIWSNQCWCRSLYFWSWNLLIINKIQLIYRLLLLTWTPFNLHRAGIEDLYSFCWNAFMWPRVNGSV